MTVRGLKYSHSLPRLVYLDSNRAGTRWNVPYLQQSLKSISERRTLQIQDRDFKLDNRRMPHNRAGGEKIHLTSPMPFCTINRKEKKVKPCPTFCDPMDCSLPGSTVHGIFQARVLEWVAISFSRGSSRPRDRTQVSCIAGRRFIIWGTREAHN